MAPGGFCEKSYSVFRFYRHPGRRLRHDLLGQRVRSNHTVHTGGSSYAADSADPDTRHTADAANTADSADADTRSSACFAAAAVFFDPDAADADAVYAGTFYTDSGPGTDAELEGQRSGEQHAIRSRAQCRRDRQRDSSRFGQPELLGNGYEVR